MNLLYALLFTRALHTKKLNPKRMSRRIKKETKFWMELISDLMQLTNTIFKFIFTGINKVTNKTICQSKTVKKVKLPENVIDFSEYRLKKAK